MCLRFSSAIRSPQRIIGTLLPLILLLPFLPATLPAQTELTLSGIVTDNSGAAVAQALITVTDAAAGVKVAARTDQTGRYAISLPSAGTYLLCAELVGYQTFQSTPISVVSPGGASFDIRLRLPRYTEEVKVDAGSASNTATMGLLGSGSLKDMPFSISAVSADTMKDLVASNSGEALRYNPTVNLASGSNYLVSSFEIRGFQTSSSSSSSSTAVDGIRSYARTDPTEDKERVEVLNGANSFLYGMSSPAGMVNYVSKRPTSMPYRSVSTGNYGGKQIYVTGDMGGPLPHHLGYRANLDYVGNGETAIHGQTHERFVASAMLEWHPLPGVLWAFDYSHYQRNIYHGDDIFTVGSAVTMIPAAPDASANYMPVYSVADDRFTRAGTGLTMKLPGKWDLRSGFRYTPMTSYRHRASDALINNTGDFTMTRNLYLMGITTYQGYIFADREFRTGAIQHAFKIGFTDDRSETKYAYPYANKNVSVGKAGAYNLYRANRYADDPATTTQGAPSRTTDITTLPTLIISDQIQFARRWGLFAGITRAAIDAQDWDYTNYLTKGTVTKEPENDKGNITPGVALSYEPVSSITSYVSYMEGLQAGPTVGSTYANANEILNPYLSSQYEIGVKAKFSNMTANIAAFHISTANTYASPETNVLTEDGREVHKGIEFISSARVASSLSMTGGFTVLNAAVTKTSTAATLHKTPVGVPKQIARLAGEYQLSRLPHFALTGGYSFTSKTWYDSANKLVVPSYMTGDAGVRYGRHFGEKQMLLFRLSVTNLTNNNYWGNSGSLSLGTPRTYACSTEYLF